jgi:cysteinyl-tRNA synthetase
MSARPATAEPVFRLYNTMSDKVEPFAPADGKTVRMYSCGPTVYNPAHLGNFRSFLFYDLLRQALHLRGWDVRQVMNLTDVDDKIIKRAYEQKKTIREVTEPITETFFKDRDYLRIKPADAYPKATDYIPQMIELVKRLLDRKVAYHAEDKSVYFAIGRFATYGRLSRLEMREVMPGARVAQDEYTKEHAQDFVLWKAAKREDEETGAAWDSPWGRGRPGWHLECSAMAIDLLGETLDVHTGGIDLRFPHHENEIAQSEAATGRQFVRYWCHGAFLLTDGTKMAKRLGNVSTVRDLREQRFSAAALRHFVFTTHYRKELNLSEDALDASMEAVRRVGEFAERLERAAGGTDSLADVAEKAEGDFRAALYDDLNAPEALAALFTFLKAANRELDRNGRNAGALERAREAFALMNGLLDIAPERETASPEFASHVDALVAARTAARQRGDFAEADRIRKELQSKGIAVEDAGGGTKWKVVRRGGAS